MKGQGQVTTGARGSCSIGLVVVGVVCSGTWKHAAGGRTACASQDHAVWVSVEYAALACLAISFLRFPSTLTINTHLRRTLPTAWQGLVSSVPPAIQLCLVVQTPPLFGVVLEIELGTLCLLG